MASKQQPRAGAAKFTKGDPIKMLGNVTIVHEPEYGRRKITVRLESYEIPVTVPEEYIHLEGRQEPASPAKRRLFDEAG